MYLIAPLSVNDATGTLSSMEIVSASGYVLFTRASRMYGCEMSLFLIAASLMLTAMLFTFTVEQRAREILKGLQQLGGDFGIFRDAFGLGLKHLKNAQSAFSDADERADRLGDKIQRFASVAQATPADEALSSPPLQAEESFQTRRAER